MEKMKKVLDDQDLTDLFLEDQFNLVPLGIAAIDEDQKIVKANTRFYEIWNLFSGDFTGKKIWEIILPNFENDAINFVELADNGEEIYLKNGKVIRVTFSDLDLDSYAEKIFFFEEIISDAVFYQNLQDYLVNLIISGTDYFNAVQVLAALLRKEDGVNSIKELIRVMEDRSIRFGRILNNTHKAYLYQKNNPDNKPISVSYLLQMINSEFLRNINQKRFRVISLEPMRLYLDKKIMANGYLSLVVSNITIALSQAQALKKKEEINSVTSNKDADFIYISFPYKGLDTQRKKRLFKKIVRNNHDEIAFGLYVAKSVAEKYGGDLYYEDNPPRLTLKLHWADQE